MSRNGVDWVVVVWLGVIHACLVAAPFFFEWSALGVTIFLHWLTGGIGVCLGYHRFLTHQSFKCPRWVQLSLACLGGLSGEGSALHWVANHRKHHAHSDHIGDPHSPHDSAWWAHLLWVMANRSPEENEKLQNRWVPDLKDDPGLNALHRHFLTTHVVLGALLAGIGYAIGGASLAASWVVWGMFVRLALVLHSTWFVNSASHMWGYRNYETTDDSRNNWWVAIIAYGEGWHNNHHAFPRMARHGHKWWEIDMTFMAVRALEACGLAWDIVDHQHKKKDDLNTLRENEVTEQDTAAIESGERSKIPGREAKDMSVEAILKAHEPHRNQAQPKSDTQHRVS
jgi:stearoyl-CoA desaturase (delta-9 desaturase)